MTSAYPHVATDDGGELRHELLVLVNTLHHLGRRFWRRGVGTDRLPAFQVNTPFPLA